MYWFLNFATQCFAVPNDAEITNCTDGEARLVNGSSANRGRLEVCINRSWATVCSSGFGVEESLVACRQLGYLAYYGISVNVLSLNICY